MANAFTSSVLTFLLICSGVANLVSESRGESTCPADFQHSILRNAISSNINPDSVAYVTTGKYEHPVASGCKKVGFSNLQLDGPPTRLGLISLSPSLAFRSRNAGFHEVAAPERHEVLRV